MSSLLMLAAATIWLLHKPRRCVCDTSVLDTPARGFDPPPRPQVLVVLDVSNVFAGHPAATCNLAAGLTLIAIVDLSGNSSTAAPLDVKDAVRPSMTISYSQTPFP